jgi:hypothetical protein
LLKNISSFLGFTGSELAQKTFDFLLSELGKNEMSVKCLFNLNEITGGDGLRWKESYIIFTLRSGVADKKSDFGSFFLCLRFILRMI